ncbi:MAG: nuclear transport factor 2 family protein [Nostoc sp. DedQUE01]
MQSSQNLGQNAIAEIFDAYLALIATNIQAWSDLLAEDVIVEFPYAAALGIPQRLEGKSAVYDYMKAAAAQMEDLTFTNIRKYLTLDPDVLLAEVHGEAVISTTGRHYQQDYVMRMQTKDGKIVHYREYWNPTFVMDTWADMPSSGT